MADIFNGSTVKVYYNDDTGNRSVITDTNTKINELAAFPSFSMTNEVQKIETYDDEYANAIEGQKNVDVVEIVVNYIPNDETHVYLDKKFDSKEEFQLTVLYRIDENAGRVENVMMNGALAARQINGGKDQVVTMTYNFVPHDVINIEPRDIPSVLHRGDFGVGANGSANYPQYEPDLATGNAFVKISAGSTDNPASVDLMGIELVNGTGKTNSNIMMTTSGDLRLYARNNTVPWTRLFTSGESDTKYMAKSANLSDVASVPNARTNLDVFSKGESDAKFVPKTTTVNGKALTGNIVLSKGDVVLGNVTNDAQLKIASNLSDLNNVAQARTNLGLGSAAVQNIGTSGANIPLLNTANTFSGIQTFTSTITGSISGTADNVRGIVPISNGGTGASDADSALSNLSGFKYQHSSLNANTNLNDLNGPNAGVYFCSASAYATPANSYPIQAAGSLIVLQNAANNANGCTQMYYPFNTNDVYVRTLSYTSATASSWTPWDKTLFTGQYGVGATTAIRPTNSANGFYGDADGSTVWAPSNSAGFQSSYNDNRIAQVMVDTSGRTHSRFLTTNNPQTSRADAPWNLPGYVNLTNGWSGLNTFNGITSFVGSLTQTATNPLEIRSDTPTMRFAESDASGSAYLFVGDGGNFRLNRDNTGGVALLNYNRSQNQMTYGSGVHEFTGTVTINNSLITSGQIVSNSPDETIRLNALPGSGCYIMAHTNPNSNDLAYRRWFIGNGSIATYDLTIINSQTNNAMSFATDGSIGFTARSNSTGSGTAYNTAFNNNGTITGPLGTVQQVASDIRLKSDVVPAKEGALERINAIGCVEFTWDWEGRRDRGFIAQQIAGIDDLYTFTPDVEDAYLNYSQTALMSDTFGAIQELSTLNSDLKHQVQEQQTQIDELKALVQQSIDNK